MGRDYDDIEKTVMMALDPGEKGEKIDGLLEQLRRLAGLGVAHTHGFVPGVSELEPLRLLGREVIPAAAEM